MFEPWHFSQGCRFDLGSPIDTALRIQGVHAPTNSVFLYYFFSTEKIHQSNFKHYTRQNQQKRKPLPNDANCSNTSAAQGNQPVVTAVTEKSEASAKVKNNVSLLMNWYSWYLSAQSTKMDLVCKLTANWRWLLSGELSGKWGQIVAPLICIWPQ